jgi:energy-coupling factor transporter ATP-binding protein EcfA2
LESRHAKFWRSGQVQETLWAESTDSPALPAYFVNLRVKNIRCFGPEQIIDFTKDGGLPTRWTIILGDNGVGKTTLLQCLAQCQAVRRREQFPGGPDFPFWQLAATDTGFITSTSRYRPDELEDESFGSDFDRSLETSLNVRVSLGHLEATLNPQGSSREHPVDLQVSKHQYGGAHSTVGRNLSRLICYGYGATRRMGAVALSDQQDSDSTASLFSDQVPLLNAEEWLLRADYSALVRSPLQAQAQARRDQLVEVLINLLPDVSDIRFVQPTEIGRKPRVEVQVPYGWVTISDLSLGYRALVAWIVDLAYRMFERYPDSDNPLAEPAIVLVDEIDLHLHPKWQRSLISYLTERFPNTQFIVTAHSPLIVQAATDANIVLLRREGDHVVIDNDVEAIRGWRIDQVLTSDLFGLETARPPEYDELLAQRAKLLGKAKLTKRDESRLKKLESEIGDLPAGESVADIEAMDVIRRAAEVLKREGTTGR